MSTVTGCGSWGLSSSDCSSEGYLQEQTQVQGDPQSETGLDPGMLF